MAERDAILEHSPLARYLEQALTKDEREGVQFERLDGGVLERVQDTVATTNPAALLRDNPLATRLALYDAAYGRLIGGDGGGGGDASLARDFADVACAMRAVPPAEGGALTFVALAGALVTAVVGAAVAGFPVKLVVLCILFLSAFFVWKRSRGPHAPAPEQRHIDSVASALAALSTLVDNLKRCLTFVREVELVSRGYRIGGDGALLSPVSHLEATADGQQRKLAIVRRAVRDALVAVHAVLRDALTRHRTSEMHPALRVDIESLLRILAEQCTGDVDNDDSLSLGSLSRLYAAVYHVSMRSLIVQLRIGVARRDSVDSLVRDAVQLAHVSAEHNRRVLEVRSVSGDWRAPPLPMIAVASSTQRATVTDSLVGALRTLGAKAALIEQQRYQSDVDGGVATWRPTWLAMADDIRWLRGEWEALEARLAGTDARREQKNEADLPSAPTVAPVSVDHSVERMGGLDVDIIGGGGADGTAQPARRVEMLEQVLELYLSEQDASGSSAPARRPTVSREERIAAMKLRKQAEEAARAEAMTVHELIRELKDVLQHRKDAK